MPDEQVMEQAKLLAEALRFAAEEGGFPTELIPEETAPLPAFLMEIPSDYREEGWAVACTVVPIETGGERFTCVQLYASLTPLIPKPWLKAARRLVEGENERLLFGNVLLFSSRLSLKYVFSPAPGEELPAAYFLHTARIFSLQADACAERCDALTEGMEDVESLLGERSFGD